MTRIARAALVAAFCIALPGATFGAQSEADTIGGVIKPYIESFNASDGVDVPFPSSAEAEIALIDIWGTTVSGSACETYAGASLGIATSLGDFAETGEAAYLQTAIILFPDMEAREYACLIEA